ncbi:MAG: hypothetical protein EOP04_22115 [Proteobacteria bacterium]|nr:MAG: hypothetical protein EOP04_22115 [Pseudomonadota bacterium]
MRFSFLFSLLVATLPIGPLNAGSLPFYPPEISEMRQLCHTQFRGSEKNWEDYRVLAKGEVIQTRDSIECNGQVQVSEPEIDFGIDFLKPLLIDIYSAPYKFPCRNEVQSFPYWRAELSPAGSLRLVCALSKAKLDEIWGRTVY